MLKPCILVVEMREGRELQRWGCVGYVCLSVEVEGVRWLY